MEVITGWFTCAHGAATAGKTELLHGSPLASKGDHQCCGACVEENIGHCKCAAADHSKPPVVDVTSNDLASKFAAFEEEVDDNRDAAGGERKVKADSSFAHSVINMVGMLIGLGQLSTPYALENGGWASVFLLVGLGAACAYTTHIMGRCLQASAKSNDYQDIGEQAFGWTGRVLAATFIYMEIFLALVSYTISLNDNLAVVFAGTRLDLLPNLLSTPQLLTLLAVLIALPSLWLRDLSSISFLSFGGILMSGVIFTTLVCTALFGGVRADQAIPALNIRKIPGISGLYVFSYAGHIVFPNIYKAMKDPSQFTSVAVTSFSLVTALYASMAFLGARLFGAAVSSQVTLSMPPHLLATKIALWATVLTPMTKYALEFAPFAMQLEHCLPERMGSRGRMVVRGGVGSVLLLLILALALTIPYFEYVLGLTGSLVSISICIVFPCAFYMKICGSRISRATMALNGVLVAVGVLLGVVGTISSSKSLFQSIGRGGVHSP